MDLQPFKRVIILHGPDLVSLSFMRTGEQVSLAGLELRCYEGSTGKEPQATSGTREQDPMTVKEKTGPQPCNHTWKQKSELNNQESSEDPRYGWDPACGTLHRSPTSSCLDFQATESEMTNVCGVKPLDLGWFVIHPWCPLQHPTRLKVNRYFQVKPRDGMLLVAPTAVAEMKEENLYLQVEERRSWAKELGWV